ncbi:hypothetical protein [Streptomyces sp. NPDC005407]|uniref:hypothetical protein n=1 Tax=Streptomyces sp. NPDC005407 TaxID=3155340 RepID=UPI0033AE9309
MSSVHAAPQTTLQKAPAAVTAPELPPADTVLAQPSAAAPAACDVPETLSVPEQPTPAAAVSADDVVGLRQAQQQHLPDITLAGLRWARANDPDFPVAEDKRGSELLYRVGDLKRWAHNRPRAATGTAYVT